MLDTVFVWLLIALFAPLASAIFAGVFIRAKDKMFIGVVCSALVILSTIASLALMELVSDNRLISVNLAGLPAISDRQPAKLGIPLGWTFDIVVIMGTFIEQGGLLPVIKTSSID